MVLAVIVYSEVVTTEAGPSLVSGRLAIAQGTQENSSLKHTGSRNLQKVGCEMFVVIGMMAPVNHSPLARRAYTSPIATVPVSRAESEF
jgi:hypothetical protein